MNEALAGAAPDVVDAAKRVGEGEVLPDSAVDAVVDALSAAMLNEPSLRGPRTSS